MEPPARVRFVGSVFDNFTHNISGEKYRRRAIRDAGPEPVRARSHRPRVAKTGLARSERSKGRCRDTLGGRVDGPERVVDRRRRRIELPRADGEDDGADWRCQLVGSVDIDRDRGPFARVARSILKSSIATSNESGGYARAEVYDKPWRQLVYDARRRRRVAVDQCRAGGGAGSLGVPGSRFRRERSRRPRPRHRRGA